MSELVITERPAYPRQWMSHLDRLASLLRLPFCVCFDELCSCFVATTVDLTPRYVQLLFMAPVALTLTVITLPPFAVGFGLWWCVHKYRKPFLYSEAHLVGTEGRDSKPEIPVFKPLHSFATANLCLLPQCAARHQNFPSYWDRAQKIAAIFTRQQRKHVENTARGFDSRTPKVLEYWDSIQKKVLNGKRSHDLAVNKQQFETDIMEEFPPVDFLLIQEGSWVPRAARAMLKQLHQVYPHVIYDVGQHSFKGNRYILNSGLMVASKYPVRDVSFTPFQHQSTLESIMCKGLLSIKVWLGKTPTGGDLVGFLHNLHLLAFHGSDTIHTKLLDDVQKWAMQFRQDKLLQDETIVFDVMAGDFNLDNMSPADNHVRKHPLFYSHYTDLGRYKPGMDHHWTIGTEMRPCTLHDDVISTPEGLKNILQDPRLRHKYMIDADLKSHTVVELSKKGGDLDETDLSFLVEKAGKRRIDFLLFRHIDGLIPVAFQPVTALANLTDHVSYIIALRSHPSRDANTSVNGSWKNKKGPIA